MKNKYRIVIDNYAGYEAQVRYWWFPIIWFQVNYANTSSSIERAEKIIDSHRNKVVKYID